MNAGDIYQTSGGQDRLILGRTAGSDIGYATRGGRVRNGWDNCTTTPADEFVTQGTFLHALSPEGLAEVRDELGTWMESKDVA